MSYDELLTVITEVESVINLRPLCYQYSDEIEEVLTPSHLLHGRRINDHNDTEVLEESCEKLNKRMTHLQTLLNHFEGRWRHEYLSELREYHRNKSNSSCKQIKLGDVVLVVDEKLPRC